MENIFNQIAIKIIKEQQAIIGPLAWSEARKVEGLAVTSDNAVTITGNDKSIVIDTLVKRYERLFGRASNEVCKHAVVSLISHLQPAEIPASLK